MIETCTHHCNSCTVSDCSSQNNPKQTSAHKGLSTNPFSTVRHLIGIVSGKGGVGKSLVTSLLASEMQKRGYRVGILDADITGPSIPKSFGIEGMMGVDEHGLIPLATNSGIKIMSANMMLPEGDMPIAWRGPVVTGAITRFWEEVSWGEIDYMFIDMPPGTSDAFLTVLQMLPVEGIVTVSAPQELVAMIVGKAVNLANRLNVPVVGLVENMSYFMCDKCEKRHYIFGSPQGKTIADRYGIPATATLPIDPVISQLCDKGEIEHYQACGALDEIIAQL